MKARHMLGPIASSSPLSRRRLTIPYAPHRHDTLAQSLHCHSSALSLAGVLSILSAIHQLVLPVIAWSIPSSEASFYDWAVYSGYSKQGYVSFNQTSPYVSHLRWDDQYDKGLMSLTLHGTADPDPGPTSLDAKGKLVWKTNEYSVVMNMKAQKYIGRNYWTFWAGKKEGSFGGGAYRMLNSSYKTIHQVSAVGKNLRGDLHEFEITPADTAIMTIYNVTNMDLTSMGRPAKGWILDSIFQEIDIATGELSFEWRASDQFHASESYMTHPLAGYRKSIPFDFFHINSVQKDAGDNYLVSSRHLYMVICISPTGESCGS